MKSKATGCGSISTVFSSIALLCVRIIIIIKIIIIITLIIIIIKIIIKEYNAWHESRFDGHNFQVDLA